MSSLLERTLDNLGFDKNEFHYRPWGGYICVPNTFNGYYPDKYLLILPGEQLSWQYHNYRKEKWVILTHDLEINRSFTDLMSDWKPLDVDDVINIDVTERHSCRNIGNRVGIIAENWISLSSTLSTEADIIRVFDKYNR